MRSAVTGRMTQRISAFVRLVLTLALAVGIVLSTNARVTSHKPADMSQIARMQADISEHGHAHDEVVEIVDAYHGHPHDVIDHDHTMAILLQRPGSDHLDSGRSGWIMAASDLPDRRMFELDRPPRG